MENTNEIEDRLNQSRKPMGKKATIIVIVALVLIAILSASVVTNYAAAPEKHTRTITALDEKRNTVMKLTAASTGISAAITALPGDTGNTVAEKLMDLSSYFLIILCALFLEKYLVTITGYAAFRFLIPFACILLVVYCFSKMNVLKRLAIKVVLFAVAIYMVVPISVKISAIIEDTYETSIESTIQSAEDITSDIEANSGSSGDKSDEGILSGLISKVKDSVTGITDKVGSILNNFIEAIAVLIVTSCIIPILVLLFFLWLIKMVLGINLDLTKMPGNWKIN